MSNTSLLGSYGGQAGDGLFFRNRILNGCMRIDQRGVATTVTPSSGQYLTDRFVFRSTQVSKFSAQQVGTSGDALSAGFTKALYMKCISAHTTPFPAGDRFTIQQHIEGHNVADFRWGTAAAKPITLSFWCRSTIAGVHGGALRNEVTATRSYPFTYTINTANTWEYKTITILGDTTGTWASESGVGISVVWSLGVGSSLSTTANAWAAGDFYSATGAVTSVATTLNAELYITGVQLEAGPVATPFERRPYGVELALCQRYYFKLQPSFDITLTYASIPGAGLNSAAINVYLPVPMRINPSITHNFANANFVTTAPTGLQWGVLVSAVAFVNKTGTASFSGAAITNTAFNFRIISADFASAPNSLSVGPSIFIDASAEL